MKKNLFLLIMLMAGTLYTVAQNTKGSYPLPEYSNEVYLLKNDSATSLLRLEKGSSQMQTKVKAMGMGGMDNGYEIEGEKSTVRLHSGSNLVFILSTGQGSTSPESDSAMKANGMDPNMISGAMSMFTDPSATTSLYNMKAEKGNRKVLLQSMGLMGMSKKTSTKYTLSIKKVKENYYEIKVDKSLPKGEYAFVMMNSQGMDQSYKIFAFAID
jgi:hypothetical protein